MTDEQIALEHARLIVRDVCEIPDRTSPDDQPEMMMVAVPELTGIAQTRLLAALAAARQDERERCDENESARGYLGRQVEQAAIAECVRRLRQHAVDIKPSLGRNDYDEVVLSVADWLEEEMKK